MRFILFGRPFLGSLLWWEQISFPFFVWITQSPMAAHISELWWVREFIASSTTKFWPFLDTTWGPLSTLCLCYLLCKHVSAFIKIWLSAEPFLFQPFYSLNQWRILCPVTLGNLTMIGSAGSLVFWMNARFSSCQDKQWRIWRVPLYSSRAHPIFWNKGKGNGHSWTLSWYFCFFSFLWRASKKMLPCPRPILTPMSV